MNIVNNIKTLGLDMVNNANSGHSGIVLSAGNIVYSVIKNMNLGVSNNRDRFVMSAGHGSALLYATLFMAGKLEIEDLKKFRKLHSRTPGHPEYGVTPYVDMSTGPLGQGIASSVGLALASKYLHTKNSDFGFNVYSLVGEGDLMEGVSYEALSLAGSLGLDNLIVLYDCNKITLDGGIDSVFNDNIKKRFEAMNFVVIEVKDDSKAIDRAILKAKGAKKPVLIKVNTILGKDSEYAGTNKAHGAVLTNEQISNIKKKLKVKDEAFYYDEVLRNEFITSLNKCVEVNVDSNFVSLKDFDLSDELSLREASEVVLKEISRQLDIFIGGSADLSSSCKTVIDKFMSYGDFGNKCINFGIREHSMGAIMNGLALGGLKPFGSTFLTFSDYMLPSIRMSALMDLPVCYIYTHDCINIGEDGPTHQPTSQLNNLRGIPNLAVFRPCNKDEILGSYEYIINSGKPSCIVLSRGGVSKFKASFDMVKYGAYVVMDFSTINGVIIATGSEVSLAIDVALKLSEFGINIRVVSMPNREIFEIQESTYKESVLPVGIKTFVIEFGSSLGFEKYVYNNKYLFTINDFGFSGSSKDILKHLELDLDSIVKKIKGLLI